MRSLFVIPFWAEAGIFRHNSILAVWSLWTTHCRYLLCKRDEKSPDNKGRRLVWSRGLSKIQMQTIVFFGDRHLRLFWLASVTHLMKLRTTTAFLRNKTEEGEFRRRKPQMTRVVDKPFAGDESRDTKTSYWDARDALEQDKRNYHFELWELICFSCLFAYMTFLYHLTDQLQTVHLLHWILFFGSSLICLYWLTRFIAILNVLVFKMPRIKLLVCASRNK